MSEGIKTPIDASFVQRALTAGKRIASGWFTPVPPMQPVAPEETKGRQYDYGMGVNLIANPRREEPGNISFKQLRDLADNYDLLRLVIETRKDQLAGMNWNIVGRDSTDKIKNDDPRVLKLEKFFRKPDGINGWHDWLRMLIEDLLVIDAPTVYVRKTRGGDMYSLDIIDGSTIKILVDDSGRTPVEGPAFQQVLKGMPAVDYTREELIYKPRNKRSWKLYGMSPVEQIIMTVNIALRRQMTQLGYYTEGNIPEAFATCPPEWSAKEVAAMQETWDNLMAGQADQKRHMKFIPGGTDIKFNRPPELKDQMDEWLARIVCYAFSVSPQALVQLMNRATAESAAETAQLEGLAPLQVWVKGFMDDIIENVFGFEDLVFEWDSGEELDPKTQAEINKIYIDAMVLDTDEVRADLGRDPRGTQRALPAPATGAPSALPAAPNAEGDPLAGDGGAQGDAVAAAEGAPTLGPDGKPVETPPAPVLGGDGAPLPTTAGGDADVQGTAMNGTQVSSLMEIVTQVANKEIPKETATALIMAAYPAIKPETIEAMLSPLENFEPPKPEPIVGPDGKPIAPGAAAQTDEAEEGAAEETDAANDQPPPSGFKKVHSHGKAKHVKEARKKIAKALTDALAAAGEAVAQQIVAERKETVQKQFAKSKNDTMFKTKRLLQKLDFSFEYLEEQLYESLNLVAKSAAESAAKSIKKEVDVLDLANTKAEKWAEGHAAELVKGLPDSTREFLRATIVEAEAEGWSNETLADNLRDNYAFSKQRADTIARTETKTADSEGAIAGWRATGLKMKKEWIRSANDTDCDICEANELQGPIELDEEFDSGDDTSPAHPNCECVVSPVLDEEQEL